MPGDRSTGTSQDCGRSLLLPASAFLPLLRSPFRSFLSAPDALTGGICNSRLRERSKGPIDVLSPGIAHKVLNFLRTDADRDEDVLQILSDRFLSLTPFPHSLPHVSLCLPLARSSQPWHTVSAGIVTLSPLSPPLPLTRIPAIPANEPSLSQPQSRLTALICISMRELGLPCPFAWQINAAKRPASIDVPVHDDRFPDEAELFHEQSASTRLFIRSEEEGDLM